MSYKNLTELPFEEYFKHIKTLNERQKRELRSVRIAEGYGRTPDKEETPYYELLKCPVKDNDKIYRLCSNTNTEAITSIDKEENILDSIKSRQMQSNGIIKWRYYKTIMWKDTKYRNLSEGALSLLNYLRTSPNSNGIGMFAESIGDISTNTNVNNVMTITQRLEELKDNAFVRYINNHVILTTFLDEQQKITKVSIIKNLIEEYNKLNDDVKLPYYPSLPTDSNEAIINSYNTLYDGIHALGQIESENGYTTEYLSIWTDDQIQNIINGIRCQADIRDNYNVYGEAVKTNIPTPKVEVNKEEITPVLNYTPQPEERSRQQEETLIVTTLDDTPEVIKVDEIIPEEAKQPIVEETKEMVIDNILDTKQPAEVTLTDDAIITIIANASNSTEENIRKVFNSDEFNNVYRYVAKYGDESDIVKVNGMVKDALSLWITNNQPAQPQPVIAPAPAVKEEVKTPQPEVKREKLIPSTNQNIKGEEGYFRNNYKKLTSSDQFELTSRKVPFNFSKASEIVTLYNTTKDMNKVDARIIELFGAIALDFT